MAEEHHPILLYDDHCRLCNAWVRILLALDGRAVLRFANLDSELARGLLRSTQYEPAKGQTVVLVEAGQASFRSDAILRAVAHLGSPWKYLRYARFLPRRIRDGIYDLIARHRYDWFGRYESCPLPPPEYRDRFLDAQETRRPPAGA